MINSLSIAVHTFVRWILMSLSVDEMLPRYINLSTNFRWLPFEWRWLFLDKNTCTLAIKIIIIKIHVHVNANLMSSWLLIIFVISLFVTLGEFPKILEIFFPYLYSFFLAGSFNFYSHGCLPFAHFIYCLPHYLWLSIFYQVSYFVDVALNVFFLFFFS